MSRGATNGRAKIVRNSLCVASFERATPRVSRGMGINVFPLNLIFEINVILINKPSILIFIELVLL
jgi:hypothetical protein